MAYRADPALKKQAASASLESLRNEERSSSRKRLLPGMEGMDSGDDFREEERDGGTGRSFTAGGLLGKFLGVKIGLAVLPVLLLFMGIFLAAALLVGALCSISTAKRESGSADAGADPTIQTVDTGTFRNAALSAEEIETILQESGAVGGQADVLRFALTKVGYPYSQPLRASGRAYDCSSLAYYAWKAAGVDLSCGTGYPPTAAVEAKTLEDHAVSGNAMQPGDLIFYGKPENSGYKGIYHVAVYAGNGKTVEAYNTKYGVIYESVRTKNVVMICRPGN